VRRRPQPVPALPEADAPPGEVLQPNIARDVQVISPFLVSGGQLAFNYVEGPPLFDPSANGVQLVTSLYVPAGRVAFLKQVRIAPFMPAIFSHPFRGWPGTWPVFQDLEPDTEPISPGGQMGVWTTPFGWEAYIDYNQEEPIVPFWRWHLRILDGSIDKIKGVRNIGRFNFADPKTWYLTEGIAVPRFAYPRGIPGRALGFPFSGQKMQVLQGDQLTLHGPVTEEKTLCLFAEWKQDPVVPVARSELGLNEYEGLDEGEAAKTYFPLLPSFGQLLGYTQPQDREAAYENAILGWNG